VRRPAAEAVVDEALVAHLLADQHPDLADRPRTFLSEGWDNVLWRLGDDLVARLPRREMSAALVATEQRWLPGLAQVLPLPIPAPVRAGAPGHGYPWAWSIVPYLAGTPAADHDPRPPYDRDQPAVLGGFLRVLHRPAPPEAPVNPYRAIPLAARADHVDVPLAALAASEAGCEDVDVAAVRRAFDAALAAPVHEGPRVWVHGDLHPDNVLVVGGRLVGVLDFGDLSGGDPASDLAAAWLLFDAERAEEVLAAYGAVDAALRARARGWAILLGLLLATTGHEAKPAYRRVGLATLRSVTAGTPVA
jgi:aminoglycoside phosphotransferase (APT) family kinase protein